jgi:dienelactone hydrolase
MADLRKFAVTVLPALVLLAGCGRDDAAGTPAEAFNCHAGAWRMEGGGLLAITQVSGGLRYRMLDGRTGRLETAGKGLGDELSAREGWREEGPVVAHARFEPCPAGRMAFHLQPAEVGATASRLPLESRDTRFRSGELELRGRLVMPSGAKGPVPLAVLVHGSEDYSAVDHQALQFMLPALGVAAFVYDKRGTGGSDGEYTQDFHVLAADAVAALAEARRIAPGAFSHTGYVGGSQGGWIAPLAASRSDADYSVALYGLAEGALAEDREQVMSGLRARGHGEDVLAKAREVTDATALLMSSGFTRGFDELAAARNRHSGEAWLRDVRGEFTGTILDMPRWLPQWVSRAIAARHDVGTSWDYEPLPVLAALDVPQLWVIADSDREAPPAETLARIRRLQAQGRPIDLVVYPDTDHGIYEYIESEDGERVDIRNPDGYHELLASWIATLQLGAKPPALAEPRRQMQKAQSFGVDPIG